jgi:hypothetical protein
MKVAIRQVGLASLGKMGCLLGTVAAFLPSLLCGLLGLGLAKLALRWLESWQDKTISILGQEIARFDLVQLLALEKVLAPLQVVTSATVPALFLAVLALAVAGGIVLALIVVLVGLAYNLLAATTGGLIVEMSAISRPEDSGEQPPSEP